MDLSNLINVTIKDEISNINHKIKGIVFLEILKYKIIESFKEKLVIKSNNKNDLMQNIVIDDEFRKVETKLIFNETPITYLNSKINKDMLVICLRESLSINIENPNNKKNLNFKCSDYSGVVIPKDCNISINFDKNSIILEINVEDKVSDIENLKENII